MTAPAVAHYGLGPIGLGIAGLAIDRGYRVVAAVDVDPNKVGRDLGALLDRPTLGVVVTADAAAALARRPQVVFHSTQSRLAQVAPQIVAILEAGAHIISTCEELAFPWRHHPAEARRIHEAAKAAGVTAVGLGVNPGFVMDLLPIALTAPCREVRAITVTRVVDAGRRRLPLQRKVGAGLDRRAFEQGVAAGRLGHVGLLESVAMIADAFGWALDAIDERIEPVLSGAEVRGLHQVAVGRRGGQAAVTLDLTMAVGTEDPRDVVSIDGEPPFSAVIAGGIHGDVATCALAVNAVPQVLVARHGLASVHHLTPVHWQSATRPA
jgi:4-hydroxy-tetrahydrodipicolinate reductase